MTRFDRIERRLPSLLDELAPARTPDYLADILQQTARSRQRSRWTFLERWLPMTAITSPTAAVHRTPWRAVGLAILVILALAAILFAVGSQRRLPAPFGPAANGSIFFATPEGDIVAVDTASSASRILAPGDAAGSNPAVSRDGTRVAFARTPAGGVSTIYAVDASGGAPRLLGSTPGPDPALDLEWSPDGRELAWITGNQVWVAMTDGSGARLLDVGLPYVNDVEWRPPDGAEILVRGMPEASAGLFLVGRDGSGLHPITAVDGGIYDYVAADWSPDGARLAFSNYPEIRVHVLSIASGIVRVVDPGSAGVGTMFPGWSPDGTRIAMDVWQADGSFRVGVVQVDDPASPITLTGPTFDQTAEFAWAPDGTLILALGWGSGEPWLLDPAGGPARPGGYPANDRGASGDAGIVIGSWQRLAP
ncbi:MAG TPA: hypothetical protein VIV06_04575 [Candidatus Limnocylindrales bacterium]